MPFSSIIIPPPGVGVGSNPGSCPDAVSLGLSLGLTGPIISEGIGVLSACGSFVIGIAPGEPVAGSGVFFEGAGVGACSGLAVTVPEAAAVSAGSLAFVASTVTDVSSVLDGDSVSETAIVSRGLAVTDASGVYF